MAPAALARDLTTEPTSARTRPSSSARNKGDPMTRAQLLGLIVGVTFAACSDDSGAKTEPMSGSGAGAPAPASGSGGSVAGSGGREAATPAAGSKSAAGSGGKAA